MVQLSLIGTFSLLTFPYTSEVLQIWTTGSISQIFMPSRRFTVPLILLFKTAIGKQKPIFTFAWMLSEK